MAASSTNIPLKGKKSRKLFACIQKREVTRENKSYIKLMKRDLVTTLIRSIVAEIFNPKYTSKRLKIWILSEPHNIYELYGTGVSVKQSSKKVYVLYLLQDEKLME